MARPKLDFGSMLADPLGELKRARQVGWLGESDLDAVGVLTHERVREILNDGRFKSGFVDFMRSMGVTSGAFFRRSMCISMKWAGFFFPVRDQMRTGLPVVSCPYMPAAEMPMPCWPRDWRRRWNFEP